MQLNANALRLCRWLEESADRLRIQPSFVGRTKVWDFGVEAAGGLEAGRLMAEICLAGLGGVTIDHANPTVWDGPTVTVRTDHPVAACMASQYAGWALSFDKAAGGDDYFAMGSGPFRATAGREEIFGEPALSPFQGDGRGQGCVGVLEASSLPPESVCVAIAEKCGVTPSELTLLVAPTNSQAGSVQVVARSVETALHKLHELGFDLARVESGWGAAPLPPVAGDAMAGIGRTNDAVLYGGNAVLYVRGDDESIVKIGPQTPSNASSDHGRPFKDIFKSYDYDFYKIDKLLFSPAMVTFVNLDTGATHRFGRYEPNVVAKSFGLG